MFKIDELFFGADVIFSILRADEFVEIVVLIGILLFSIHRLTKFPENNWTPTIDIISTNTENSTRTLNI